MSLAVSEVRGKAPMTQFQDELRKEIPVSFDGNNNTEEQIAFLNAKETELNGKLKDHPPSPRMATDEVKRAFGYDPTNSDPDYYVQGDSYDRYMEQYNTYRSQLQAVLDVEHQLLGDVQ